ncbi:ornithine carbamoyltransferase [Pseudalkalibacillus caeni]|uniref:Ornithine carbamoyltransferase n=1 Tax=Exobacillus caeni TaxID=2574798 RepID=A0A5R9F026_9BACL|nr:ornithine carbamoyltransferase [Pseudalkalibacillus caeni]TLS36857.1 ornithine carbamoyltransferase [Pseudalkalibacillus caeni]
MHTAKLTTVKSVIEPNLKGKDFLKLSDFNSEEILYMLELAIELKKEQKQGTKQNVLDGKTLGMIFEKSSTRTRVSFEVGMTQLGGQALFLSSKDIQLGRGESVYDTAKVLSRYVDCIMIRTFEHDKIEEFAAAADVPVINGLTDTHHPTQVMADLLTILEHKGQLSGLKMAYLGDGDNNMTHSLIEGAAKVGMNLTVASPEGYEPEDEIMQKAIEDGYKANAVIELVNDPVKAVEGADVIVTDVWASMGQEEELAERLPIFQEYQVNEELCKHAKDDFIFMHCLPAHRGEEVTAGILDGAHSVVYDEAENRLHAQKAILKLLMEKK